MIEPRLFTAEEIERCVRPAPNRAEMFVVVAYLATNGNWRIAPADMSTWFFSERAAREAAARLSRAWTYIDIIRIPGGD